MTTEEEIRVVNNSRKESGIQWPLEEELELKDCMPQDLELPAGPTSEEESEAGSTTRPKRGSGWWAHRPTLLPFRNGIPKPFVDDSGLRSPGIRPIQRRMFPDNELVQKL